MTAMALCVAFSKRHHVLCVGFRPTVDPVSKSLFLPGFLKVLNQEPARNPLSFFPQKGSVLFEQDTNRKFGRGEKKRGFKG